MSVPWGSLPPMSSFRFLHAADLHLDTPFEGLGAMRPELAERLREASLRAFDRLVDLALEERVSFVVIAGDVYDGAERGLRAQLRFRRGLERLSEAGIASFVAHGNHDPVDEGWGAIGSWPPRVHVFGSKEVESIPVEVGGARIATVHGISFGRRAETANLATRFRRGAEAGLHVGLLHCNVEGSVGHDPYAPCSLADLRAAGMDYWALGHVHTRQLLMQGACWAAYPGNLQGRSFKPAEQGAKGALLVHVENDSVREAEFRSLAPVVFASVEVDISGYEELASLEAALLDAAAAKADGSGCEGLMVSATIRGRGPLHAVLRQRVDELREALADATSDRSPWIRWERIVRDTAAEVDRDRLLVRGDLVGQILRELDRLSGDAEARRSLVEDLEEPIRGALAKNIAPLGDEEALVLLKSVELEALDRLEVEA